MLELSAASGQRLPQLFVVPHKVCSLFRMLLKLIPAWHQPELGLIASLSYARQWLALSAELRV